MGNAGSAPELVLWPGPASHVGATRAVGGHLLLRRLGCGNGPAPCAGPTARPGFSIGFRDILDGLSNTAAFSERVKGIGSNNNQPSTRPMPTSSVLRHRLGRVADDGIPDRAPQAAYAACKAAGMPNRLVQPRQRGRLGPALVRRLCLRLPATTT